MQTALSEQAVRLGRATRCGSLSSTVSRRRAFRGRHRPQAPGLPEAEADGEPLGLGTGWGEPEGDPEGGTGAEPLGCGLDGGCEAPPTPPGPERPPVPPDPPGAPLPAVPPAPPPDRPLGPGRAEPDPLGRAGVPGVGDGPTVPEGLVETSTTPLPLEPAGTGREPRPPVAPPFAQPPWVTRPAEPSCPGCEPRESGDALTSMHPLSARAASATATTAAAARPGARSRPARPAAPPGAVRRLSDLTGVTAVTANLSYAPPGPPAVRGHYGCPTLRRPQGHGRRPRAAAQPSHF